MRSVRCVARRSALRAALSILAVAGALLAGAMPQQASADDPADALEALEAAKKRAAESAARRAELDRAILGAQAELASTRAELAELADELQRVRSRRADAEQEAVAAAGRAESAAARLQAVNARLATTRDALARHEALFADQARHAYTYGSVAGTAIQAAVESLTTAESPAEFTRSLMLVDSVLSERVAVVDEHVELVAEMRALAAEARRLQAQRVAEEAAATAAHDHAAALVARQEELVAELAEREARQEALLGALEVDRDAVAADEAEAEAAIEQLMAAITDGRGRALGGDAAAAAGVFHCPVDGPHAFINDWGFPRSGGRTHEGTDIFAPKGTPIVAMADGTVVRVSRADRGLGGLSVTYVVDGFRMYNAHLASVADGIAPGVTVAAGEEIGTVGTTGNARGTPPHNHFGLYTPAGRAVNPYPLLASVCR